MINYNLSELVNSQDDIELDPITERLGSQREYRKILREIIKAARRAIIDSVLPAYALSISDGAMMRDGFFATAAELVQGLKDRLKNAAASAILSASIIINRESRYLDGKFIETVKRKANTDISALVRPADNSELIARIVERNTALITSLSDETLSKVTQAVIDAQLNGWSKSKLKDALSKILGKQASRADLIAEDQLEKLSAEIIADRAKQAGLNIYIWLSRQDDRVRDYHRYLNGKKQDTRNPNHGDKGMFPRQPIRCRCRARWVIGGVGVKL